MKLGVYVGSIVKEQKVGGIFTFQDVIIRYIEKIQEANLEVIILYSSEKKIDLPVNCCSINLTPFDSVGKRKKHFGEKLRGKIFKKCFSKIYAKYKDISKNLFFLNGPKYGRLHDIIEKEKIDMVYCAAHTSCKIDVPFIFTVWDLGHRVVPFFPEVSTKARWEYREKIYSYMLPRASYIITGNAAGAKEISTAYGILPDRIKIIPFFTPEFALNAIPDNNKTITQKIDSLPYIFYPAQFWPHKNHIRLLQALNILHGEKYNQKLNVIFTGIDKGNLQYLGKVVTQLKLDDYVTIKGFVSQEELVCLYRCAETLVYVSYMGPNNLPPLEAMALGCPVIASDIEGHRQQLGDAAWYIDPNSAEDIASKINEIVTKPQKRSDLIDRGGKLAQSLTPQKYVDELAGVVNELKIKRECWDNSDF